MIIRGSTALVTGASSGIGAAVAGLLVAKGARVIAHGRDEARLRQIDGVTPIVADLAQPDEVERLADAVGSVDILVANAGMGFVGDFTTMHGVDVDRLVQVNLTAPIQLTRLLLPAMRGRDASIVYVTSIAGRTGVKGEAVYAATKAGLDAFAESLRFEVQVRVGVLVPGVVDTPFFARRGQLYQRKRPRPIPVGPVATACVRLIETGAAEVYRPSWLRAPVAIRGVAPRAYRALATRFGGS